MSSGPIATASVKVVPDTSTFQADLQRAVNAAVKKITVPAIKANVATTAAGATAAASGGVGGGVGRSASSAAKDVQGLTRTSAALRGTLIGISHVTPVTVFGLTGYGVAALAAASAVKIAIRSTADFEHQLYVFQATTGATAGQMEEVAAKAKALGADLSLPSTSAGDAARAMTELAKAGLSVEDTLAGSTGVLQLAAAAQLDVGQAAQFVATELNAFGLAGDQATHVADLLAGASIAAQGSIIDFANAFQQVSAVSNQVELDLETTTGALTELARAGLRGADGGTSLRTTLLRLAPTTKQAAQYQKALGIEIDKNLAIGKQLPDLLDQYRASLDSLTKVEQQQALAQIFGQDAIRAASILIRGGSQALDEATDASNQNGAANRLAQANALGLSGAFNGLKSNLDTLGITIGGFVSGPLEGLTRALADVTNTVGGLVSAFAGLKTPDFLGGETVDKVGRKVFQGIALGPIIGPLSLLGGRGKPVDAAIDTASHLKGGRGGFKNLNEWQRKSPAEQAKIAAAIRALAEDTEKKKLLKADTQATNRLQINQLNAQLKDDLQAELKADKAIESYFEKRLKLAKAGTNRYTAILGAYQQAHSATTSVQGQIDANAQATEATAKAARDKAAADRKKAATSAAADAKALFNLQKSSFDLEIQRVTTLFPNNKKLARQAYNAEIAWLQEQIKKTLAIKNKTVEQKQSIIDLRAAVYSLKGEILNLNKDQNEAFSPGKFFATAVENFRSFGSNIASGFGGILSGQDARGALGASIVKAAPQAQLAAAVAKADQNSRNIGIAQLAEQRRTNRLLGIMVGVGGRGALQFGFGAARGVNAQGQFMPGNMNPWRGN